ncbi:MAG TPA: hypothetical protein VLE93_02080 [Candidatus Saccharimonadales bacterium]|nr:hypothetical protein [Candidatus Saccharimonadales bacterium]
MRKILALIFVVLTLGLSLSANAAVKPALIGSWHIRYTSQGRVAVRLGEDLLGPYLDYRVLPLTGDHNPGPCGIRFDGSIVAVFDAPPYQGRIRLPRGGCIRALKDEEIHVKGLSNHNAHDIQVDDMFFGLEHSIEAYFVGQDSKGNQNKDASAAPATQFVIDTDAPETVATTKGGQSMTAGQLDAAIKQAYDQGKRDAAQTGGANTDDLMRRIKDLTDENNRLREEKVGANSAPIKLCRYLPIKWSCNEPVPNLREQLTVYVNGQVVATASVVEVVVIGSGADSYHRVWVKMEVLSNINIDQCEVRRTRPQGGK